MPLARAICPCLRPCCKHPRQLPPCRLRSPRPAACRLLFAQHELPEAPAKLRLCLHLVLAGSHSHRKTFSDASPPKSPHTLHPPRGSAWGISLAPHSRWTDSGVFVSLGAGGRVRHVEGPASEVAEEVADRLGRPVARRTPGSVLPKAWDSGWGIPFRPSRTKGQTFVILRGRNCHPPSSEAGECHLAGEYAMRALRCTLGCCSCPHAGSSKGWGGRVLRTL